MADALSIESLAFRWPGQQHNTLSIDRLQLPAGSSLFVRGPSGSGKSTLLNLLAGVLVPTEGVIQVLDQPLSQQPGKQRDRFRADHIGYIFQQFNLLPYLSVIDNVMLPCRLSRRRHQKALSEAESLTAAAGDRLTRLNIPESLWLKRVSALSVGQQQRVAAARALMGLPELVIADEPTSALDQDNVDNFMDVLTGQCQALGSALVFVSHDRHLARWFDQELELDAPAPSRNEAVS
ncbi:ABC transporter ATP-binding protein [Saccharospirillum impatiens]|uniref:ABC transporter ATP-binding protein n=1 Tax=Saccharospirillum impatiens TaxID=169438 RepID=UPI0004030023|nr:ABC transporter ATP-binding protein [Saccharospirillum impatiens]